MKKGLLYSTLVGLVMLFGTTMLSAQNEFMLAEQMFSRINKNPAATGNSLDIDVFLLHRQQWVGFGKGRPMSTLMNVHSYFDKAKSGVGLSISHDMAGVGYQTINAKVAYSYQIDLWKKGILSLGVSGGILNKNFDPREHVLKDIGDMNFPDERVNRVNPDFDFGLEFSTPWVMVGGAVNHIGMLHKNIPETLSPKQSYTAYVRGNIKAGEICNLIPAVTYMNSSQFHVYDANFTAFFVEKYWIGLGARYTKPISAMIASLGFEWNFLRIGYTYELSLGQVSNVSYHTHEVTLSFKIPTNRCKPKPVEE